MNEELKNQLGELVKKTLELAQRTGQFVIDQAPDLLREFYRWQVFSAVFWVLVAVAIFLTVRYSPNLYLSKKKTGHFMEDEFFGRYGKSGFVSWVIFILGSIASFFILVFNLYNLLFLLIAPKMYLIDYFLN